MQVSVKLFLSFSLLYLTTKCSGLSEAAVKEIRSKVDSYNEAGNFQDLLQYLEDTEKLYGEY